MVVLLCCLFARSSVCCSDRSLVLPVSCGFECGGRGDMEEQYSVLLWKDYPVPCTVCVRWTRLRRPGEFTSRESCNCACWIVLPMVLSTVHCFPSLQCGRVREFESPNSTMSREHCQLYTAVRHISNVVSVVVWTRPQTIAAIATVGCVLFVVCCVQPPCFHATAQQRSLTHQAIGHGRVPSKRSACFCVPSMRSVGF